MPEKYTVKVNGDKGEAVYEFGTLANAGSVHDNIKRRVPGVTVDLVLPDGLVLVNPTFPEALDHLAKLGYTVLDKSGNPPAEPVKAAPVRKVTARTRTTAATATTRAPRKKVAAASK